MAYSYVTASGTGSLQSVAVPPFISKEHIRVTINNTVVTNYSWLNDSTIMITAAPGAQIRVTRSTSPQTRLTDYISGTSLTEAALDTDSLQAFYLIQETMDAGGGTTIIENGEPVVIPPPTPQELQEYYPYAVSYEGPPVTQSFIVTLPRLVAQFGRDQVIAPLTTHICPPRRIVDVWLKPDGNYIYTDCALTDYWQLPRYDNYLHVARLQTSATKIQGIYLRRPTVPLRKYPVAQPYNDFHFKNFHIVPSVYGPWVDNSAVVAGFVYRTVYGDLWMCEESGVCSAAPTEPTYNEEINTGFAFEYSGTAVFSFRGRSTYSGAWRVSARAGVTWYFSHLAAGLMADRMPVETLRYLKAAAFHIVDNWVSGVAYQEGRKVAGPLTQGWAWEAQSDGVSTGVIPFPTTGVTMGTTCTDGTIIWRAIGPCAHPTQKFFWYDAEPTLRGGKSPDSHDSYAACWVWAIWRYMKATGDASFMSEASPHQGYTYSQLIKEVIYSNLSSQIGANKLTKTFQGDGIPFGGYYMASFFMDNTEVWAGYYAAFQIYSSFYPDPAYALEMSSYTDTVRQGLEALWEPETGTYKYVDGLASMAPDSPGNALFYPLCMSQAWGHLWGVPLNPLRHAKCFEYMHKHYPYWWARNDVDDLLALGAHYALVAYSGNSHVRREILERVELERLQVGQADLYVMDGAYYLTLRDTGKIRHLCG